jgi:hypothetical protein
MQLQAQTKDLNNVAETPYSKWSFKVGVNLVDNSGDRSPFDGFDFKKMGFSNPIAVGVDYKFSQHWSVGFMLSNNEFINSNSEVDQTIITEDMNYFATDVHLKYSFWSAQSESEKNFNLYLLEGFGNFKIVESTLSYNAGFGMVYWFNDVVGFRLVRIPRNFVFKLFKSGKSYVCYYCQRKYFFWKSIYIPYSFFWNKKQ